MFSLLEGLLAWALGVNDAHPLLPLSPRSHSEAADVICLAVVRGVGEGVGDDGVEMNLVIPALIT